jgi:2-dehydropantoate 2-reductase
MAIDDAHPSVLVFGAGAVGKLLGGVLAAAGCRVTLLGRRGSGGAIAQHGLRVERPNRVVLTHPRVIDLVDDIDTRPDIILLTTRTFSVSEALPDLRKVARAAPTLVTFQNGIGTDEVLREALPNVSLVAGSLTLSAESSTPGTVTSTSRSGGITLAPVSANADINRIAEWFRLAGINTEVVDDYRSMKWSKLVLNTMANVTSAILGWSPARVYSDPALYRLEQAMMVETFHVIHAEGSRLISLPGFPVPVLPWIFGLPAPVGQTLLHGRVGGARGEKMPSLYVDIEAGRERTEARWL